MVVVDQMAVDLEFDFFRVHHSRRRLLVVEVADLRGLVEPGVADGRNRELDGAEFAGRSVNLEAPCVERGQWIVWQLPQTYRLGRDSDDATFICSHC